MYCACLLEINAAKRQFKRLALHVHTFSGETLVRFIVPLDLDPPPPRRLVIVSCGEAIISVAIKSSQHARLASTMLNSTLRNGLALVRICQFPPE